MKGMWHKMEVQGCNGKLVVTVDDKHIYSGDGFSSNEVVVTIGDGRKVVMRNLNTPHSKAITGFCVDGKEIKTCTGTHLGYRVFVAPTWSLR